MKPASSANMAGMSVEDFEKHHAITAPEITNSNTVMKSRHCNTQTITCNDNVLVKTPPVQGPTTPIIRMSNAYQRPIECLRKRHSATNAAMMCANIEENKAHKKI